MKSEPVEFEIAGKTVAISSPGKVMFPERGETKLDLANYYVAVGDALMGTVRDRPTLLQRWPNGVTGQNFFQKRIPDSAPEWLETTTVATVNGTESRAIVMADLAHVLWAANQGVLGFHPWPYRASDPDDVDELRIDLDPSPGTNFEMVRESAAEVRRLPRPRSASRRTRRRPATAASTSTCASSRAGIPTAPARPPSASPARWSGGGPTSSPGSGGRSSAGARIFIDFNQNAPHKTVFGAWCVRARVGAQVSTPFRWDELPTIHPDQLTLATVPDRLARDGDPWAGMDDAPQSIEPLVARYRDDLANGVPDAPWPPVYPKMPDEARRVNPSRARPD